ncbi:hypothetical protein Pelo_9171 [Pelomyxa schiedti]|nr:hypothetical protein Pelo_9171 [Pelomyxa schiedti]
MQKWEVHPVDSKSPTHIQNGTCYTLDHAAVTTLRDTSSQLTTWESSAPDHYPILLTVSPKPKIVWNRNRPPRWTFENPAYKLHLMKLLPDALTTQWPAGRHTNKASVPEALRIIESTSNCLSLHRPLQADLLNKSDEFNRSLIEESTKLPAAAYVDTSNYLSFVGEMNFVRSLGDFGRELCYSTNAVGVRQSV